MFPRLNSAYLHIIQPPQVAENTFWYAETTLWRCMRKNDILFDLLTESVRCLERSGKVWNFLCIVFQVWICYKNKNLVWKNVDASGFHVQKFTFLKKKDYFCNTYFIFKWHISPFIWSFEWKPSELFINNPDMHTQINQ